jgi:enamine deaminase RidA (YjgF/YER057c/UK114 family)
VGIRGGWSRLREYATDVAAAPTARQWGVRVGTVPEMSAVVRNGLTGDPAHMSQVVRSGNVVAVSGQVAIDESGDFVGIGEFAVQAELVFDNVERWLAVEGATWADVVQITTHLVSAECANEFLAIRQRRFGGNPPASTTVIAALLHPDFLIEVTVLAVLANGR